MREVTDVNKKILVIVATLTVVMLVTPMVGTAQACRWRRPQTFEATFVLNDPTTSPYIGDSSPGETVFFGPTDDAWITSLNPEGHKYGLVKDFVVWGTADCGPIGIGNLTITWVYWLWNLQTKKGSQFVIYHLEFDGDYGAYEGTLMGSSFSKLKRTTEPPGFQANDNVLFLKGTDDFTNVMMRAYSRVNWDSTLIYYGKMICRIWGLP